MSSYILNLIKIPALKNIIFLIIGIMSASWYEIPLPSSYNTVFISSIFLLSVAIILNKKYSYISSLIFLIIGFLLCSSENDINNYNNSLLNNSIEEKIIITAKVISKPQYQFGEFRYNIKLLSLNNKIILHKNPQLIIFTKQCPNLFEKIKLSGKLLLRKDFVFYSKESKPNFYSDKIFSIIKKPNFIENRIIKSQNYINKIIQLDRSFENQSILKALILADKSDLPQSIKESFRRSGISHLLALSGFHIAILFSAISLILLIFPFPRNLRVVICIIFIWYFFILTGEQPSLFRASIAISVFLLAPFVSRRGSAINSLSIAGIIWLIANPSDLFTASFILSYVATLAIILIYPKIRCFLLGENEQKGFMKKFIAIPFLVSASTFIFTTPIIINFFGNITFVGIFLTLPIAILFTLVIYFFIISLIFSPIGLAPIFINFSSTIISIAIMLSSFVSNINFHYLSFQKFSPSFIVLYYLSIIFFISISSNISRKILYLYFSVLIFLFPTILIAEKYFSVKKIKSWHGIYSHITVIKSNNRCNIYAKLSTKSRHDIFSRSVYQWIKNERISQISNLVIVSSSDADTDKLIELLDKITVNAVYIKIDNFDKLYTNDLKDLLNGYETKLYNSQRYKISVPNDL